jgi:hypothetical protein
MPFYVYDDLHAGMMLFYLNAAMSMAKILLE